MPLRASVAMTASLLLASTLAHGEVEPDDGFLEFLGMLVQENDEYLDPLDMEGVQLPDADTSTDGGDTEEHNSEENDAEENDAEENSDE